MAKAFEGADKENILYFIEYIIDNFDTPTHIDIQKIDEVKKIDTAYFNQDLYTFTEGGHRYYYFNDESETLTPQMIRDDLEHVALIKTPIKGHLCTPKNFNPTDNLYGFTDDPFQNSYSYLWYEGEEA